MRAVEGVSFHIDAGETVAIVGESGCGKSVTAMSILRLIPEPPGKIAGRILLPGPRSADAARTRDARASAATTSRMIFQEPMTSLNPVLTVGRQIGETLRLHQGLRREAGRGAPIEMLTLVGIPAPERRVREYPHQLSGGMRQRVMIAMALACNPKLLIADEPTTALDVTIQAQILDLMRDLKTGSARAIMLITHDLGVVAEMAERVVVMYAGRKVEEGAGARYLRPPAASLHARPARRGAEARLVAARRTGARKLTEIPGLVPSLREPIVGCAFAGRCPLATELCRRTSRRRWRRRRPAISRLPLRGTRDCWADDAGSSGPLLEVDELKKHFPLHGGLLGARTARGPCGRRRHLRHRARRDAVAGGRDAVAASPPWARRSCA